VYLKTSNNSLVLQQIAVLKPGLPARPTRNGGGMQYFANSDNIFRHNSPNGKRFSAKDLRDCRDPEARGICESIIASREEMDRWRTEMFGETAAASSVP
jgi:hypothetical protein